MGENAGTTPLPTADRPRNEGAGVIGEAPYIFDVEVRRGVIYTTDAANGFLSILKPGRAKSDPRGGTAESHHCG
jgi:hypothetical protein